MRMKLKVMQTRTHIQSSTVVIIYAIIGSERDTIRDNTKNQGYIIVYIIHVYAWTYVCNFCTLTHICCVHSLPWLTTRCLSSLFILENSLPKLPRDYTVNFVLVYPVNACM